MKKCYFILPVMLLVVSCTDHSQPSKQIQTLLNENFIPNVKTVKAVTDSQVREITFAGHVTADPDKTISYSPLVNGVVVRTNFSLGEKVNKGAAMLDIRSTELSTLQAELISQEAELKISSRELKSAQTLYTDKMISEKELLAAEGKYHQAKAAFDKTNADISVYGMNKGEGLFTITSPVSGYVISKKCPVGSNVSADNEALFSVADLSEVWVIANIYASNLQFVRYGMEAEISAISYPNEIFKGKIDLVSQVFDPDDKVLKARIVLPNTEMKLKPEMSVVVKLRNQAPEGVVSLPSETVIFDKDAYFIVVKNDSDYSIRRVIPMGHHGGNTYLSGVEAGEDVVVKNQLLIYNELKGE
ncbi:efflux RND transporter periplasmic adaptor subunit [Bacteroides thetaiotaomicron]|uniref:efflux RND transporter periplasmic adaptor subunit n=1 Tax=Bacteroides thetaiotaomicron TaxID=818 RepID=UPI00189F45CC|nr:efflux RND transporter periplasmic adaptor subunit [Bacteroides thetaiotaomicron]MDC2175210.1 efflux RND transporter periplasmic adaptor subunit [Bacteroides thetaiotaomicron]MDC2190794.1 efflux RND transporter periplasmic adaptor subunit [Bacteroides thetaiotaomicron]